MRFALLLIIFLVSFVIFASTDDTPNSPVGKARGINPGRVVWKHDPTATKWDGQSNYYWLDENTNITVVASMLSESLQTLTGTSSDSDAWDALFRYFNKYYSGTEKGYQPGQTITIKVNENTQQQYVKDNKQCPAPQLVKSLLRHLTNVVHVAQDDVSRTNQISIYDASRALPPMLYDPPQGCSEEFPNVHYIDSVGTDGRELVVADNDTLFQYSAKLMVDANSTKLPLVATKADYIINFAVLRGHDFAGMTLTGKNWFGSMWHPSGGWNPAYLHDLVFPARRDDTYHCHVDLMGHRQLGGKVMLFVIDGLWGGHDQSHGPIKYQTFNNSWTSSLFVSQDHVAIDSVGYDFLHDEPNVADVVVKNTDHYLHEAAQADDPPSGVYYDPDGLGRLPSLGVHEHWNNAQEKKYTRNLGTGDGIELIAI